MGPKETALLILSVIKILSSPSIFALNFDQSQNASDVNTTTTNFFVQDFSPAPHKIPTHDPSSAPYESSTSAISILTVTANPNVVFKIPATKRSISSSFISFTTPSHVYSTVTPSHLYTHVVTVSSYQDYLQFMRKIPSNKIIKVAIKLQNQFDWPDNASIVSFNSLEISALLLDGPFSLDIIIQIIQQTTNLEEFHLHNSNNQLCARNQGQLNLLKLSKYKVYLPMLKKLILENFESCMEVYEMLATMLEPTEAFQTFAMSTGIVDNRNVFAIERLLKSNQKSINALVFQQTEFNATFPVFASGLIMPEVRMIRWDSVTRTEDKGYLNIDADFCKTFPKLQLLYSKSGYMHWSNVLKLAKCKKLRKLHLTVETTHHNSQEYLSILEQDFPHLRNVDVKLFNTNGSNIGRWLKKNKRQ